MQSCPTCRVWPPAARFSQSMISSLTNQGKLRFKVYDGALNASIFLNFLKRLVRDAVRKIFLIVDNLRVHRAKIVTAWVKANKNRIELFYLPPYAPDRNPDEFLNNDLPSTSRTWAGPTVVGVQVYRSVETRI